jgi:hypothetical protein
MAKLPKKFKIPRNFTLMGHRYTIEFVDNLYEAESAYGECDDDLKKIRLQSPIKVTKEYTDVAGDLRTVKFKISDITVLETFFHEATHAILDSMGEDQLSSNEKFVNMFSKSMLEIYLSSEYDEAKK